MERNNAETKQFHDDLLSKNPGVNVTVVDAYRKLEAQLSKLGVKVKRRYSIEPPLGSNRNKLHTVGFRHNKFHNRSD